MRSISWDRTLNCYILSDGAMSDRFREFSVETALDVSLSSLRRALANEAGISIPSISSLPPAEAHEKESQIPESMMEDPYSEVVFASADGEHVLFFFLTWQGHLRIHFQVENPRITDKSIVTEAIHRLFGDACSLVEQLQYSTDPDHTKFWSVQLIYNPIGRTVGSVWEAYKRLSFTLTTYPSDLAMSSEGVQLALRLGRPDVLIGAPESAWLEVKSYDYHRLSSEAEKIKLAQDVARFANAEGGLLVLGLRTNKLNGVDVISRVTPLPLPSRSVSQYRKVIDAHVYPLVRGLDVFTVQLDRGELLTVSIPPQPDDEKPFVVHGNLGGISDGKVKGQFVSVVHRRGDEATDLSGPAIHGLFASQRTRQAK